MFWIKLKINFSNRGLPPIIQWDLGSSIEISHSKNFSSICQSFHKILCLHQVKVNGFPENKS